MSDSVDPDALPSSRSILFYQTASGQMYEQMLKATEKLHRAYCAANGLDYVTFIGIRRGYHPWQATFNRIEMVGDLLDAGFRGWFVYVDADAVVVQTSFDLRRYLGKRENYALIAASAGDEVWQVNAGIFFLNFDHACGREIAARWRASAHAVICDAMLESAAEPWQRMPDGREFPDDQHLLHVELRGEPRLAAAVLSERSGLINLGGGRFIRQLIRLTGSPLERLQAIRRLVLERLGPDATEN